MIWSEVTPIREVIECSKDDCRFFFLSETNLIWGDKGCFIFHRRQFLLHHYQITVIKIRHYFVLLHVKGSTEIEDQPQIPGGGGTWVFFGG